MWKLGLWPLNSFSGNIFFNFSGIGSLHCTEHLRDVIGKSHVDGKSHEIILSQGRLLWRMMSCGPVAFIVCIFYLTLFVHTNGQVRHCNRLSGGGVVDSIWFNRVQSLTDGFISCENTGGIRHRSVPPLVNPSVRLYVPLVPPYFYPDFSLYKDVKSAYLPHFWNTNYE